MIKKCTAHVTTQYYDDQHGPCPLCREWNLPEQKHKDAPVTPEEVAATSAAPQPETLTTLLDERGKRYGKFSRHAEVTQALKDVMAWHNPNTFAEMRASQREALEMIAHKIGRILNGDPDYADSWRDIAGYAQLVADELEGVTR